MQGGKHHEKNDVVNSSGGPFSIAMVSTVQAQGSIDLPEEGRQVVAAAKYMIASSAEDFER